jgi:hypothetical protein
MSAAASIVLDVSVDFAGPRLRLDEPNDGLFVLGTAGTPEKQDTHCIQRCDDVGFYIFALQPSESSADSSSSGFCPKGLENLLESLDLPSCLLAMLERSVFSSCVARN